MAKSRALAAGGGGMGQECNEHMALGCAVLLPSSLVRCPRGVVASHGMQEMLCYCIPWFTKWMKACSNGEQSWLAVLVPHGNPCCGHLVPHWAAATGSISPQAVLKAPIRSGCSALCVPIDVCVP